MKILIEEDRRITVDRITNQIRICQGSTFSVLTDDLGLTKLSSILVTMKLNQEHLIQRFDFSLEILAKIEANVAIFLSCVAGVEHHIYQFNPEKKKFNQKIAIRMEQL